MKSLLKTILKVIIVISLLIFGIHCHSKSWSTIKGIGKYTLINNKYAPFPHDLRKNGYNFRGKHYTYEKHYNDRSSLIFIPNTFNINDKTNLVFYFHGWNDSIKKSVDRFNLLQQFKKSNKNAVLIFPQAALNTPDSFGGKFEDPDGFKNYVEEIMLYLKNEKIVKEKTIGNIILSGHSGAYRIISYILDKGGLTDKVIEVYIFDGLYDNLDKFYNWAVHSNGRLIIISTKIGGTRNSCYSLVKSLEKRNINVHKFYTANFSINEIKSKRIIFIFTSIGHEDVINPYFKILLNSSSL